MQSFELKMYCCRLEKRMCRLQVRAAATEKQEDVDIEEDAVPSLSPYIILTVCPQMSLQWHRYDRKPEHDNILSTDLGPSLLPLHADE